MHKHTITALDSLTNQLYDQEAEHFHQTRAVAWEGWQHCLRHMPSTKKLRVADIGCGNGRFGVFLRENISPNREIEYFGLDTSRKLLEIAQQQLSQLPTMTATFNNCNIVEHLLQEKPFLIPNAQFDLVVAFGLLHHIPSFELRQQLLKQLAANVAAKGVLIVSFWQFATEQRFLDKAVDPATLGIRPTELEPGDFILPWDTSATYRYCHHCNTEELDQLVAISELRVLDSFLADGKSGKLNQYLVLQKA